MCCSGLVPALGKRAVRVPLGCWTEFESLLQIKCDCLWCLDCDFDNYTVIIQLFFKYVKMLEERGELAVKQITKTAGRKAQWKRVWWDTQQFINWGARQARTLYAFLLLLCKFFFKVYFIKLSTKNVLKNIRNVFNEL